MRISLFEWPLWTLKEFFNAYKAWADINIHGPWERARAQSFYSIAPWDQTKTKWEDVFPLAVDKIRKKSKKKMKATAFARDMNEEEKELYKQLFPNG